MCLLSSNHIHSAVGEQLLNTSLSFKDCITFVKCFSSLDSFDADCEIRYGTEPSVLELVIAPLNTEYQLPLLKPLTRYYFVFSITINLNLRIQIHEDYVSGDCKKHWVSSITLLNWHYKHTDNPRLNKETTGAITTGILLVALAIISTTLSPVAYRRSSKQTCKFICTT